MSDGFAAVRIYQNTTNSIPVGVFTDFQADFIGTATSTIDPGVSYDYDNGLKTISGLTPATEYWFWTELIDDQGNSSGILSLGSITTASGGGAPLANVATDPSLPLSTWVATNFDENVSVAGNIDTIGSISGTDLVLNPTTGAPVIILLSDPLTHTGTLKIRTTFRASTSSGDFVLRFRTSDFVSDPFTLFGNLVSGVITAEYKGGPTQSSNFTNTASIFTTAAFRAIEIDFQSTTVTYRLLEENGTEIEAIQYNITNTILASGLRADFLYRDNAGAVTYTIRTFEWESA